ncbi:MAG: DUF1513 domain-containing protein [Sneathiella sp.]|nr:DUF1513 domain-containing protein [Sneathiella sp.]
MVINRRQFTAGSLALIGMAGPAKWAVAAETGARFAGTAKSGNGYVAAVYNANGQILREFLLEGRGHGLALSPDGQTLAVFARRPGYYIRLYGLNDGRLIRDIHPAADRHFYGHGIFAPNGDILYATENDFEGERGVIGIYDAARNFVRIGEYETGEIGPHELVLMQDQKTIAVANGGIATHPDFPRQKLNLFDMTPSLSYLDRESGEKLQEARLPDELHQLSIRHLAEGPDQTIWFAGQFQGSRQQITDIIGYHRRGMDQPQMIQLEAGLTARLHNYGGSVSCNLKTGKVAVTSPRGGVVLIFDGRTRQLEQVLESADICAVSPFDKSFIASTGQGEILDLPHETSSLTKLLWDNHAIAL